MVLTIKGLYFMSIGCPPMIFGCAVYVAFPPVSSNRKPKIYMENGKCYLSIILIIIKSSIII